MRPPVTMQGCSARTMYRVTAAVAYGLTSVLILGSNKMLLSFYGFNFPLTLAFSHMLIGLMMLYVVRAAAPDLILPLKFDASLARQALPTSMCFVLNCVLGMVALNGTNIPVFATLRRLTVMMVMLCEWGVLHQRPKTLTVVAVATMILGSFIGGWADLQFDWRSYGFVLLNNLVTALNLVFLKRQLSGTVLATDTFGVLYYNSLLSMPVLFVLALFSGELYRLFYSYPYLASGFFQCAFLLSGITSFLLNVSTFWCTQVNSALTTSVTGQVKNVLSSFIALLIATGSYGVGVRPTPMLVLGLTTGLVGSALYAYSIFRAPDAGAPQKSQSDSVELEINDAPDERRQLLGDSATGNDTARTSVLDDGDVPRADEFIGGAFSPPLSPTGGVASPGDASPMILSASLQSRIAKASSTPISHLQLGMSAEDEGASSSSSDTPPMHYRSIDTTYWWFSSHKLLRNASLILFTAILLSLLLWGSLQHPKSLSHRLPLAIGQFSHRRTSDGVLLPPPPRRVVGVIPIALGDIRAHITSLPLEWFQEMARVMRLFYVVSKHATQELDDATQLLQDSGLTGLVDLLLVDSPDREYPPMSKELGFIPRLVELYTDLDAICKFDSDTYVDPSRLHLYIDHLITQASLDNKPVYAGRPLHHCQCHPKYADLAGAKCTEELGISYCSGAMYFVNRPAIQRYVAGLNACVAPSTDIFDADQCPSSDTRMGLCFNMQQIQCTPATMLDVQSLSPVSHRGKAWGIPNSAGVKLAQSTQICQILGIQGGVKDRSAGESYVFQREDWEQCFAFHPLKAAEDMRYARFVVDFAREPFADAQHLQLARTPFTPSSPTSATVRTTTPVSVPTSDPSSSANHPIFPSTCRVGIGILSTSTRPLPRDVIRSTWGRIASAVDSVKLYFIIGDKALAPHEHQALQREMAMHQDLLFFPHVHDGYQSLFNKTLAWLDYGMRQTKCEVLFKTDDDSYIRVMPLLTWLGRTFSDDASTSMSRNGTKLSRHPGSPLGYFGWQWGSHEPDYPPAKQPHVVKDTSSPWYMYDLYPHQHYPPYMSGHGYGMTRGVAELVLEYVDDHPEVHQYRVEDAGVGIIIHTLNLLRSDASMIRFYTGDNFDYRQCHARTIMDNPGASRGFNMYTQYMNDLYGEFCQAIQRAGLTSANKHTATVDDVYQFPLHQKSKSASPPSSDESSPTTVPASPAPLSHSVVLEFLNASSSRIPPWSTSAHARALWAEREPWKLVSHDLRYVFRGVDTVGPLKPAETGAIQKVVNAVKQFANRDWCSSQTSTVLDVWQTSSLQRPDDFLLTVDCPPPAGSKASSNHLPPLLVHVPYQSSLPTSFETSPIRAAPLALVVPFACAVDHLAEFLDAAMRSAESSGAVRIVVAWMTCATVEHATRAKQAQYNSSAAWIMDEFGAQRKERIPLEIVHVDRVFSRGPAINAGVARLTDDEIAIVLDIDMHFTGDYLRRCRALTPPHTAYFPISFSRYNPAHVPSELESTFRVHSNAGVWREYGYGMTAFRAGDMRATNAAFDDSIEGWGAEDVNFYQMWSRGAAVVADTSSSSVVPNSVVRAYEPSLVHMWHPKDCSALKGTDKFGMCLSSKAGVEGTALQIAKAYWKEMKPDAGAD